MKIHCLQLKNKELNKFIAFFLISVIRKVIEKTEYSDQISSTTLPNIKIKLPVDNSLNPDWKYMEEFVKNIEIREKINRLNITNFLINSKPIKINTIKWKRFNLYDENLFDIFQGNKLDKRNMTQTNPSINFIGRSSVNNGITEKVDLIENTKPYDSGLLTLALGGAYLGSCFIQKEKFYTSQNVIILKPKQEMTENTKQFIATLIFKESQTYYKAFEDELNRHIKTDFSILLPVDESGKPDFFYMDNYINYLKTSVKKLILLNN